MAVVVKKVRPITESHCIRCNRQYPIESFYKSDNPNHSTGVIPYCKTCSKEIFIKYYSKNRDLRSSLWVTCSEMGMPFLEKVYNHLLEKVQRAREEKTLSATYNYWGNFIASYMSLKKKTDRWDSFLKSDLNRSEELLDKDEEQIRKEKLNQFILDWGDQEDEDYAFLEYKWDFYTEDINIAPAQESLYRKLCLAELAFRKAKDKDLSGKEEQDSILKLMKALKIDNFVQKKEKTLVEQMIEAQIRQIEETTPAECVDLDKYKDFSDIESDWFKIIVSSVKNIITGSREYPLIPRRKE